MFISGRTGRPGQNAVFLVDPVAGKSGKGSVHLEESVREFPKSLVDAKVFSAIVRSLENGRIGDHAVRSVH